MFDPTLNGAIALEAQERAAKRRVKKLCNNCACRGPVAWGIQLCSHGWLPDKTGFCVYWRLGEDDAT